MKAGTTVRIILVSTIGWVGSLFAQTPPQAVQVLEPQQPMQGQAQPEANQAQQGLRNPLPDALPNPATPTPAPTPEPMPQQNAPVAQDPAPVPMPQPIAPVIPEPVHEEPVVEESPTTSAGSRYSDPEKASFEAQATRRIEDLARLIGQLESKAAQAGRHEKRAQEALRTAAGNRSVAKTKLKQLSNAGADDWKALKKGVETAMQELERSVDRSRGFLTASES